MSGGWGSAAPDRGMAGDEGEARGREREGAGAGRGTGADRGMARRRGGTP
jgi:hypothetical protein